MAQRGTTAAIDLLELEKLCALQCSDEELAFWSGVTPRTIERRRRMPVFREAMERGKVKGRISIRRAQLRMLEQGNSTMGIWLGKQYLGQRDHVDVDVHNRSVNVILLPPPAPLEAEQIQIAAPSQQPGLLTGTQALRSNT